MSIFLVMNQMFMSQNPVISCPSSPTTLSIKLEIVVYSAMYKHYSPSVNYAIYMYLYMTNQRSFYEIIWLPCLLPIWYIFCLLTYPYCLGINHKTPFLPGSYIHNMYCIRRHFCRKTTKWAFKKRKFHMLKHQVN